MTKLSNSKRSQTKKRQELAEGINQVRTQLPWLLEDAENGLTALSCEVFADHYDKLKPLDEAIKALDQRINRLCRDNELSRRFLEVPGIGPVTATIIASDIGTGKGYESGRDYAAASLGIVPKQHSSSDKPVYLGISKRGNRYIRTLLIHSARSVLKNCAGKSDKLSAWLQVLIARRGFSKAAVALANKNDSVMRRMIIDLHAAHYPPGTSTASPIDALQIAPYGLIKPDTPSHLPFFQEAKTRFGSLSKWGIKIGDKSERCMGDGLLIH